MQRPLIIYFLGGISIATTLASVVLNSIYATSLDRTLADIRILAFVAAVLNAVGCIAILILLVFYVAKVKEACSSSTWKNWGFGLVGVFLLATAVLVGITMGRSNARYMIAPLAAQKQRRNRPLFLGWCGVWGASVISQGLFYGFLLVSSSLFSSARQPSSPPENTCRQLSYDLRTLPNTQEPHATHNHHDTPSNRSFTSQRPAFSFRRQSLPGSDRIPNSVRSSLSGDMRLVLSRSRMRSQNHSQTQSFQTRRDSRASSYLDRYASLSEDAREPEQHAFDQWDTSAVSPEIRDSVWQSNRDSNGSVGTIGRIQEQPISPPPVAVTTTITTTSSKSNFISPPPSSPPSRGRGRSSFESHIHPLFRSDSPNPPPIITTPRTSTSISRPPTATTGSASSPSPPNTSLNPTPRPSPLKIHSEGIDDEELETDGPGPAVDSQRSGEGEGVHIHVHADRNGDEHKALPIPGFILSAGTRSSLVGYEKRRDVS
ncbi:hypothetical protein FQN54_007463 [Arachnomyces sp. PD_36]|nr:hypothetical protein FQN54_007463 [Arachnomyces sp. PD_36]